LVTGYKNHNSRFLKVNFPKNKYFPEIIEIKSKLKISRTFYTRYFYNAYIIKLFYNLITF